MRCGAFIKDPGLSSMHYARRWPWASINSMGQASVKQYKPRSREKHCENSGAQCLLGL